MFRLHAFVVASAIVATSVVGAAAQHASPPDRLPRAVQSAFTKAHPKGVIDHWAAEQRDGSQVFELETHEGTVKRDLLYAANGTLIESEESIPEADLPVVVRQAVRKAYPRAAIQSAERVVRGKTTEYEIGLAGAETKELVVSAGGAIVTVK